MDGPIFDAMLKTALEEALREDMRDLDKTPPVRQSRRQKKRMRRMLADPWGYRRRYTAAEERQPSRRPNPARWLAVVVVAALLTGTAAGYALRGGGFFQKMFDASPWAEEYGAAADTEQLMKMGSEGLGTVTQDDTLRLELVDAVSDGQFAMVAVHLTVLDQAVLEKLGLEFPCFMDTDISQVSGGPGDGTVEAFGTSIRHWIGREGPEPGAYSLIFSIDDAALLDGGAYRITLQDLAIYGKDGYEQLAAGEWSMEVTLLPGEVLSCAPERLCRIGGTDWVLEHLTCSALAMKLEFRSAEGAEDAFEGLDIRLNASIALKDGRSLGREDYVCTITGNPDQIDMTLEFQMPVDVEQIESVTVCGQEIPLEN